MISPTSGTPFQTFTVTGTNFGASEAVKLFWDSTSTTPLVTPTTSAGLAFTGTITVPQAKLGAHTLIAVGQTSGLTASIPFQIKPAVFLVPNSGKKGSVAYLIGVGFGASETVAGLWYPGFKPLNVASSTSVGTVVMSFTVPMSPTGTHYVIGYGLTTKQAALAPYTVTALSQHQVPARSNGQPSVTLTWECSTAACGSTSMFGVKRETVNGHVRLSLTVVIPKTTAGTRMLGGVSLSASTTPARRS